MIRVGALPGFHKIHEKRRFPSYIMLDLYALLAFDLSEESIIKFIQSHALHHAYQYCIFLNLYQNIVQS